MLDNRGRLAAVLVVASRIVLVLAAALLALGIWSIGQGRGHKVGLCSAFVAVFCACAGAALTTSAERLEKGADTAPARLLGVLALAVASYAIVADGISFLRVH